MYRPSESSYDRRRAKLVDYILNVLDAPDILGVQEVGTLGVLGMLANDIAIADPGVVYTAYLVEGNDIGGIDVGFLVRDTVGFVTVTQLGKDEMFDYDNPPRFLHDRPPLLLEGRLVNGGADYPIAVMVVHNRSLSGITGERTQIKRLEQAQSIAEKVQAMQTADPDVRLVIVGDFNAFEFTDGYVDVVGQIAGNADMSPAVNLRSGPDLVDPDLFNQLLSIPPAERYSFIFRGNAQALDHALTSMALDYSVRGLEFGRGNADAAVDLINDEGTVLRASDHDGFVLFLTKDKDNDGVNDDADVCPGTTIPEAFGRRLGVNRFALIDDDFIFDTRARRSKHKGRDWGRDWGKHKGKGKGPGRSYTTEDTAGCSCTQIIAAQGLGKGHTKFGCSIGAMKNWISLVNP